MVNSILVDMIKALRPEELAELHAYLLFQTHNRGPRESEMIQLFERLQKAYPQFETTEVDRQKIYVELYGMEHPVKGKLEKAMTELGKQVRNYVLSKNYLRQENKFGQMLDWAIWLRSRSVQDRYLQTIDKIERMQAAEQGNSAEFHYRQYLLEEEKHNWQNLSNQKKDDVNLTNVIRHFSLFYHLNHLEFLNRMLVQQSVTLFESPQEIDLDLTLGNIPNQFIEDNPILFAEASIFKLFRQGVPPVEEVLAFKHWMVAHEHELQPEFKYRFWAYLRGLCSILINAGNLEIVSILHQIHVYNLEKGYLLYEGKLSPSAYKNVAHVALVAKETNWALEFVERYKDLVIGENESRDFYHSNLANCYFSLGAFEKALYILPATSSYSDYHSAARRLELKIYFELDSPLLPYKIDSFKMYVHRAAKQQLSKLKKEMLLNFVNLLQQIVTSPKGDKLRSQQIIQRIEQKKSVAEKKWLIEKAHKLA